MTAHKHQTFSENKDERSRQTTTLSQIRMHYDNGIIGECRHGNHGRHNLITMVTQRAANLKYVEHEDATGEAFLVSTLKQG